MTSIGNYAFSGCGLTSVSLGNGVTTIGREAFYCQDLSYVFIPDSVTSIDGSAFSSDVVLLISRNSYALQYAKDNNYDYVLEKFIEQDTLNLSMDKGEVRQLTASVYTIEKSNISDYITWKSTNESVVAVSSEGVVSALTPGESIVIAQLCNGKFSECRIIVNIPINQVEISESYLNLNVSDSYKLTAQISPDDTTYNQTLTWKSSDENVAIVDQNGNVTAESAGITQITVKTVNGLIDTCDVRVIIPVKSALLNSESVSLEKGKNQQLIATVFPENATIKNLTWKSSDSSVVSVDQNGKLTANGAGNATITATTYNGISVDCAVTVFVMPSSISISNTSVNLDVGKTLTLPLSISPSDVTEDYITWSSSNERVAKVDLEGKIIAISPGVAIITAKTINGLTAQCTVHVINPITNINLNLVDSILSISETLSLVAIVEPYDTNADKTVRWSSNNPSVASVNQDGLVTAVSTGVAVISATSSNGKIAKCNITVDGPIKNENWQKFIQYIKDNQGFLDTYPKLNYRQINGSYDVHVTVREDLGYVKFSSEIVYYPDWDGDGYFDEISHSDKIRFELPLYGVPEQFEVNYVLLHDWIDDWDNDYGTVITDEYTTSTAVEFSLESDYNFEGKQRIRNGELQNAFKNLDYILRDTVGLSLYDVGFINYGKPSGNGVIDVQAIKLNTNNISLNQNEKFTLKTTITPSSSSNKTITWTSSEASVAKVNKNGVVTAKHPGIAMINAISSNGKIATCVVTVLSNTPTPTPTPDTEAEVLRVKGKDRYDTSIAIANTLKEQLGVDKFETVILANGQNFADALAGSYLAAKKNAPIIMINTNNTKTVDKMIDYVVSNLKTNGLVYVLGGTGAVSDVVEQKLDADYEVVRLKGKTRYETSIEIAKEFFGEVDTVILASAQNFPDGLCGGPLAYQKNAPLILTYKTNYTAAKNYATEKNVHSGYVLGGAPLVTDEAVKDILGKIPVVKE